MTSMTTKEAEDRFSDVFHRAAHEKERGILTCDGHELVAVVPIEDVRFLQELEDRQDVEDAMAALAEAEEKGTIPWERLKAELGS